MHIAVKICGIASADAVDAAVSAGAAYGGLVFHPKSPRFVALDQAKMLAARMRGQLKSVTLIADLDDARIEDIVTVVRPDFLQLHGNETAKRAAEIRARFAGPRHRAAIVRTKLVEFAVDAPAFGMLHDRVNERAVGLVHFP